jgi:predicted nucleotidyltransferase
MNLEEIRGRVIQVCLDQRVKRLELFGSRARSAGQVGRDYDFLVTFDEGMAPEEYSKRFFETLHGLEDVLGSPVDLLTPGSIKKTSLRDRIMKEKVTLYES